MQLPILRCVLACFMVNLSQESAANEDDHRWAVNHVWETARTGVHSDPLVFFSELYLQKEAGDFTKNSGRLLLSVPAWTSSTYDTSVKHSLASFYSTRQWRTRWVINYIAPKSQWLLSLGHDTGVQTPKLSIAPAVFLGIAKHIEIHKNHSLQLSWGQWWGGQVSERPCLDDYDREYWCPNLTAWTERPVMTSSAAKYYELKYQWQFH